MRTYENKDELKNEINKSFAKYISEFNDIPEHLKDKRIDEIDRTPAENLAYQVGWTTLVIKWESDERNGLHVKTPSDDFKWNQLGELYKWFTDTYAYLSLQELKDMLKENYEEVQKKITEACKRAGRNREEVTLIAVSKTKPVEMLSEIYDLGERNFGENKVQELTEKEEVLPKDIHWHMIGHLQRNKVKYIAGKVALIHSVDSLRLAKTISEEAVKHNCEIPILIEVNVAGEESKFGVSVEETLPLIEEIAKLPAIHVEGLMTIAPYVEDPEENRPVFRKLKELSVDIAAKNINNVRMAILSMGMTGDYEVAVEEGATLVRVGTGVFGERDYSKR